jgi:hypothetical protein
MKRFYISSADPEADLERCRMSRDTRSPITISGQSESGGIEPFTGVVQSVLDMGADAPPGRRWRVTIE